MPHKYPPLTPSEIRAILKAWNFARVRTEGSHERWIGAVRDQVRCVTLDVHYKEFDDTLIRKMIGQAGLSREEFYCADKRTAAKIDAKYRKPRI